MFQLSRRDWTLAADDLWRGLSSWYLWTLLGVSDIRQRYKRSRFGQFWITLSMAIFVGGIGLVYGYLFNQPMREYIPYLAANMVVWTFLSGVMTDSTGTFVEAGVFLRQDALPKTVFVMRVLVRNLIGMAHNLIIIPVVFLLFGVVPSWTIILALPGLALTLVAAYLVTLGLGILSARFRDLPQIIQNLVQLAFFITPVLWRTEQLGENGSWVQFNPFATFLRVVAEPIHGQVPSAQTYIAALVIIALLLLGTWPLFARFRARVVYWL